MLTVYIIQIYQLLFTLLPNTVYDFFFLIQLRFCIAPLCFILNTRKKIDGFIKTRCLANIKLTLKISWTKQSAFYNALNDLEENIDKNSGFLSLRFYL